MRQLPVIKRFLLYFISISALPGLVFWLFYQLDIKSQEHLFESQETAHVNLQSKAIFSYFKNIESDLAILSELHELRKLAEGQEDFSSKELEGDFLSISLRKGMYDQIRLIGKTGQEMLRVNYNNGKPLSVPKDRLQNKASRYYFKKTMNLNKEKVYVSPLDLNIERGEVEKPFKPMIRFGTPIFNAQDEKQGILVLNFMAQFMIDSLENSGRDSPGQNHLFNSDGYWLSSPNPEDEWGFMVEERKNKVISNTFPDEWTTILDEETGQFSTQNGLFTFTTFYPAMETEKLRRVLDNTQKVSVSRGKANFWKIVSFVPQETLYQALKEDSKNLQKILLMLYAFLVSLIGTGTFLFVRADEQKRKAEETTSQKEKLIQLMQEITITANEASTVEEAIQTCLDKVCEYMDWPIGHLYTVNSIGQLIPSTLWYIENPLQFETFRKITEVTPFDSGVGLPGRVMANRKPGWIRDVTKDPNFPRAKLVNDICVKAGFAFPVLEAKKVVGVLEFFSEKAIEPDESVLEALSSLATQLGRVTERKRVEEKMKELNCSLEKYASQMEQLAEERSKQLIHADRMAILGTLSAGVAHEINNPVSFVRNNLQIFEKLWDRSIRANLEKVNCENEDKNLTFALDEMPGMVKAMKEGTTRIISIVHGLGKFSRRTNPAIESSDICEVIESAVQFCRFDLTVKHKVKIQLDLPDDIPNIKISRQEIEQVLINLITNSGHAMADITDRKELILKIAASYISNNIVIEITDNGHGMDEKTLGNIFNPFFTTKDAGKGTGLGLSICRGIIDKHRGTITAKSTLGERTSFTIKLPVDTEIKERREKKAKK